MPYIQRNSDNKIISLKQTPDDEHEEYCSPTHIEIVEFLTGSSELNDAKETLSESDQDFTRVTEDLINLLIEKNIILFTELPTVVQQKMVARKKLRSNMHNSPYNFLDDSESL
ncbi:hypothetical protein AB835_00865 [Candidatus Endobugula sertula]|uniref:Tryptophan synthase subunit beta like protein n=1 Tax=Candidatus Endobugula sertula TaxID=62101 RepID=A0A1D2QTI4_9GAMM|nr:hypothetical protein AB835_00865 [Candidatus Endobugula sertula]